MNIKIEKALADMFKSADDPLKSKWWIRAWELLHDAKFGPAISNSTTPVELGLWLVALRNTFALYEATYWQYDYESLWIDWLEVTGIPEDDATAFLRDSFETHDIDGGDTLPSMMHTWCWAKNQAIFDTLFASAEYDETNLYLLLTGGKEIRDHDRAMRLMGWVGNEFWL